MYVCEKGRRTQREGGLSELCTDASTHQCVIMSAMRWNLEIMLWHRGGTDDENDAVAFTPNEITFRKLPHENYAQSLACHLNYRVEACVCVSVFALYCALPNF